MSFRAIWIISRDDKDRGQLLFSRKYPTVERRFKLIHGKTVNTTLSGDDQLVKALLSKLEIGRKTDEFTEEHDSCRFNKGEPVLELAVNDEKLWPVVAVQKFNLVLACLALVETTLPNDDKPPLVEIPAVAIGYALLHDIARFLDTPPASNVQAPSQIEELNSLLKILMPFGTPSDTNLSTMKSFLTSRDIGWSPKYKLSAWHPVTSPKPKNQLQFITKEKVDAVIYSQEDKTLYKDVCHTYGTMSCKADVEGVPEISVNFISNPNIHVVFHPCLQSFDLTVGRSSSVGNSQTKYYSSFEKAPVMRNIRFTPPLEEFPFCHYNGDTELPIKANYQYQMESKAAHLEILLQLNEGVKNSFESCEVSIPFFHSKTITKTDMRSSCGSVLFSKEKRKIVWSVGQKFSKSLRATFTATLRFGDATLAERRNFKKDPFCRGPNTYIQLLFKTNIGTLSGVAVDPKSIQITPSSNVKIFTAQELLSSDYKVWNAHGDALVAFSPTI